MAQLILSSLRLPPWATPLSHKRTASVEICKMVIDLLNLVSGHRVPVGVGPSEPASGLTCCFRSRAGVPSAMPRAAGSRMKLPNSPIHVVLISNHAQTAEIQIPDGHQLTVAGDSRLVARARHARPSDIPR
jgi:hypothetical protein